MNKLTKLIMAASLANIAVINLDNGVEFITHTEDGMLTAFIPVIDGRIDPKGIKAKFTSVNNTVVDGVYCGVVKRSISSVAGFLGLSLANKRCGA